MSGWLLLLLFGAGLALGSLLPPQSLAPWLEGVPPAQRWWVARGLLGAAGGLGFVALGALGGLMARRWYRGRRRKTDEVEQWLSQLHDPDPERRRQALEALASRLEERTLLPLAARLADPQRERVEEVALALEGALQRLAASSDAASLSLQVRLVAPLLGVLNDRHTPPAAPEVVERLLTLLAEALGQRESRAVIEPLLHIARAGRGEARERAALMLYRWGSRLLAEVEPLLEGRR